MQNYELNIIRSTLLNADALAGMAKPARASAFIGVSILLDADALAGIAMPVRASAFDRF